MAMCLNILTAGFMETFMSQNMYRWKHYGRCTQVWLSQQGLRGIMTLGLRVKSTSWELVSWSNFITGRWMLLTIFRSILRGNEQWRWLGMGMWRLISGGFCWERGRSYERLICLSLWWTWLGGRGLRLWGWWLDEGFIRVRLQRRRWGRLVRCQSPSTC